MEYFVKYTILSDIILKYSINRRDSKLKVYKYSSRSSSRDRFINKY